LDIDNDPTTTLLNKDKSKKETYSGTYSNKNQLGKFTDNGPRGRGFSNYSDPYRVGVTNRGGGGGYKSGATAGGRKNVSTAVKTRIRR